MRPHLLRMLEFKTLTLADREWMKELCFAENVPSAGFNFGNIYLWNKHYKQLVARFEDRFITRLKKIGCGNCVAFSFPIGRGPVAPAIEAMRQYTGQEGCGLVMRGLAEKHCAQLEELYPGRFRFSEDVDYADYVYLAEKLSSYSGKALHGKKNHCNRFEADNDWDFVPLTRELIPECMDMLELWSEENAQRLDGSVVLEHDALIKAFAAFEPLGLEGGALRIQGKIVGFTMGEMTTEDCFDVHFEKARPEINGAYPMTCRELTRMLMKKYPQLKYMNREEDMGLEALRKSKLSYKPEMMVRKFSARWIDG